MGQILALPFDVQKLPGLELCRLDPLTGDTPVPCWGYLPQSPEMESRFALSM